MQPYEPLEESLKRLEIMLPSEKDLPAPAASSDCSHLGAIVCLMQFVSLNEPKA
tara:strand:- start:131 stop:292 length:162 start_codon:yes stop_codon:yes gene_type:complete